MLQLALTFLSLILTPLLTYALLKLYFSRTIPEILNDVGASIGEQFGEIFEKPAVKQAMSVMGKKSGEVRASNALRNKAADKILEGVPSIGFILDQLDLTPVEGLQLMNDPLIGPFIKRAIEGGLKGLTSQQNPSNEYGGKM